MEWFLGILAFLFLCAGGAFAWRFFRLRRMLQEYQVQVRQHAEDQSPSSLPLDVPGLEDLSNSVHKLAASYQAHLQAEQTERIKLASILEQMTDGVLIADAEGWVTFMNPAAMRMFDVSEASKRRVIEILRHYQLVDAYKRCKDSQEAQSETLELTSRHQFLQMFVLPDRVTNGALILVQDLTKVRRLETVRRDFISNVSHELRTPLASLKALTETLQDGALEDSRVARRFLGSIETEVDALTQMTQELLDLSRIESGQSVLQFTRLNPGALIRSSVERMRAQAERAGLVLKAEVPLELAEFRADASRLEQVLVNLIHNAIKFTQPGGEVTLSAAMDGTTVHFQVRDTGAGMPEEDLERIFERFYKADRARSGGGTGLGLSIARHIVESHGGRIWAESLEGRGSTFHFTIPQS